MAVIPAKSVNELAPFSHHQKLMLPMGKYLAMQYYVANQEKFIVIAHKPVWGF